MQSPDIRSLRAVTAQTVAGGSALWHAGPARRARWLAQAMRALADESTPLGTALRSQLADACGLSPAMIAWGLKTSLSLFTEEALLALDARCTAAHPALVRARPGQLAVVVLAGNVFTAAARGIAMPLLFGWPVVAKASSREDVFAALLEIALSAADPELGTCFRAVNIASDDDARAQALFEQADAVSVYGGDNTLNLIRARLSATVSFIPHGHGLGVAVIGKSALSSETQAREVAQALALDVAAYDQRGCLSPHVAWAVRGAAVSPLAFAKLAYEALATLKTSLPRGTLPMSTASAQLTWRAQAALRGSLLEGDGFSVANEFEGSLRVSPGYRNLLLLELDDEQELAAKLAPLSTHLKCLGVAGLDDLNALLQRLPARVAPRVCDIGQMQTPPLDALADGLPPWDGLVRFIDRQA